MSSIRARSRTSAMSSSLIRPATPRVYGDPGPCWTSDLRPVHRGVGQPRRIHLPAGPDQLLYAVDRAPRVDVHPGEHVVLVVQPEGQVRPRSGITAKDHLVRRAARDVTGVLHAQVVLVGEEERDRV